MAGLDNWQARKLAYIVKITNRRFQASQRTMDECESFRSVSWPAFISQMLRCFYIFYISVANFQIYF